MGYQQLTGFDYVPESIKLARQHDTTGQIQFDIQDAVRLDYPDGAFKQAIYLQQVLCFIEDEADRKRAVGEAYRVLQPGSTAIFSVLSFDERQRSKFHRYFQGFLQVTRGLRGSERSIQLLPWLRLGGKANWRALLDTGPYNYWFRIQEFLDLLQAQGFEIAGFGTTEQIAAGQLYTSVDALLQQPLSGQLFVVAHRP